MSVRLIVSYDTRRTFGVSSLLDGKLREAAGQDTESAGSGFGQRDLEWVFASLDEAEAARARVENTLRLHGQPRAGMVRVEVVA